MNDSSEERPILRVVKLSPDATIPVRATPGSVGVDLCSATDETILPGTCHLCPTHLQIGLPVGCYGRIAPRSGLALKHNIDVGGGVVDSDYRGDLGVLLINHGKEMYRVKKGDRIAQLICERISLPDVILVTVSLNIFIKCCENK